MFLIDTQGFHTPQPTFSIAFLYPYIHLQTSIRDHAHGPTLHPDVAEQQDLLALLQAPINPLKPVLQFLEAVLAINHLGGILQLATC